MDFLKKYFGQSLWNYLAAVLMAVATGVFRYVMLPKEIDAGFLWYEVLSVAGFMTFLIGALLMVAHFGAFDIFSYVFSPGRRKYKDYTEYSQHKEKTRSKDGYFFMPFFVVGVLVVLVSTFFA